MERRILFVVGGSFVYGTEVNMLHYMTGLRERGWRIHCVVNGWNDGDFIARLNEESIEYSILHLGFIYLRKPLWTFDMLIHLPGAWIRFSRILKTFQPQIIFHVTPRTIVTLYPFLGRATNCLRAQEVFGHSAMNRLLLSIANRRASKILAVSRSVKNSVVKLGVPEKKVHIVYNGLTFSGYHTDESRSQSINGLTLGVVGRMSPAKGQAVVIEALRQLPPELKFQCLFVGNGDREYVAKLKDLTVTYGIENKVEWIGYVKDPVPFYDRLDILIIPSFTEAFGIVALEGALRSVAVVASRIEGLEEVIKDNVTGLLFAPGNAADLVDKITTLASDPDLRRRIAKTGYEYVRSHFSQDTMIQNTDFELAQLLN